MTRRRLRHTLAAAVLAAAPVSLVAGCGSDEGSNPESSKTRTDAAGQTYNAADVTFATDMIQHHAQALVMVDLTRGRDLDAEVAQLMEEIRAAQAPEIETMVDLLQDWEEPVPETSRDHANAHGDGGDHGSDDDGGGHEMPGMMSDQQLDELEQASDTSFRTLLLRMMIEHHEGAVEMARAEQQAGASAEAISLAEQIETGQLEEIATMQELLEA